MTVAANAIMSLIYVHKRTVVGIVPLTRHLPRPLYAFIAKLCLVLTAPCFPLLVAPVVTFGEMFA